MPLLQGDDYILYCHPHKQKTPRSDRLREWYLTLLRAAKERGIVAHISNLFDTFFEGGRDHRVPKPSVTHMPYLEGADPTMHLEPSARLGTLSHPPTLTPEPEVLNDEMVALAMTSSSPPLWYELRWTYCSAPNTS